MPCHVTNMKITIRDFYNIEKTHFTTGAVREYDELQAKYHHVLVAKWHLSMPNPHMVSQKSRLAALKQSVLATLSPYQKLFGKKPQLNSQIIEALTWIPGDFNLQSAQSEAVAFSFQLSICHVERKKKHLTLGNRGRRIIVTKKREIGHMFALRLYTHVCLKSSKKGRKTPPFF